MAPRRNPARALQFNTASGRAWTIFIAHLQRSREESERKGARPCARGSPYWALVGLHGRAPFRQPFRDIFGFGPRLKTHPPHSVPRRLHSSLPHPSHVNRTDQPLCLRLIEPRSPTSFPFLWYEPASAPSTLLVLNTLFSSSYVQLHPNFNRTLLAC